MLATVRLATPEDAQLLSELGARTFRDTFVEDFGVPYSEADLAIFLPASYGIDAIRRTLDDPACVH